MSAPLPLLAAALLGLGAFAVHPALASRASQVSKGGDGLLDSDGNGYTARQGGLVPKETP